MGYFPNGTSGDLYQEKYCDKCHWGDKPCTIWLAHMEYNYEECNKKNSILHILIPKTDDGLDCKKCTMFIDKAIVRRKG